MGLASLLSVLLMLPGATPTAEAPDCPVGSTLRRTSFRATSLTLACIDAEGRREGPYRSYIAGELGLRLATSGAYQSGLSHGTERHFEAGAMVALTEYRSGRRHGRFERWRHDGRPLELGVYVDDAPVGVWIEWTYHDNGQVESERHLLIEGLERRDGPPGAHGLRRVPHGMQRHWHDNGQLAHEGLAANGEREGVHRGWEAGGRLLWRQENRHGRMHGRSEHFWKDGYQLETYVDGVRHGPSLETSGRRVVAQGGYVDGERHGRWQFEPWLGQVRVVDFDRGWERSDRVCPEGTTERLQSQSEGRERACLLPDGRRHGPYVAWGGDGIISQRGTYAFGGRQGDWRIRDMGSEAWVNDVRSAAAAGHLSPTRGSTRPSPP